MVCLVCSSFVWVINLICYGPLLSHNGGPCHLASSLFVEVGNNSNTLLAGTDTFLLVGHTTVSVLLVPLGDSPLLALCNSLGSPSSPG